jgi:threonine dehydrogenase-like Zn-dependent dehydrogenase
MNSYWRVEYTAGAAPRLAELPADPMRESCARIRVRYCSVNRTDISRLSGWYGGVDLNRGTAFGHPVAGVRVPGYEPVGVVEEVAANVDPALVGQWVLVHSHTSCGHCAYCRRGLDNYCPELRVFGAATPGVGGWSEELVVPAAQLFRLPERLSPADACSLEVTSGTAYYALLRGRQVALSGRPVAVRGVAGAVALAAAQICRAWGVPVAGIVRDPDSSRARLVAKRWNWLPLVSEADARNGAVADVLGEAPFVVIEPLGAHYLADDLAMVARGGAVGVIGAHIGVESVLRGDVLFHKGASIYGTTRAPLAMMADVARLITSGQVEPLTDRIFPLADFRDAVAYAEHPEGLGRVLLEINHG